VHAAVGAGALGLASACAWAKPGLSLEEKPRYTPPPRFNRSFSSVASAMPGDEAGRLVWAVKNLEVEHVQKALATWPEGANILDEEDNSLFHVAAGEPSRCAAQPDAAAEVLRLLLETGWDVVDIKNQRGERAEVVAARLDPQGLMAKLLGARSHDFAEKLRAEEPLWLVGDESPEPWKWQYLVQDDKRRCYAGVAKAAFPPEKCKEWMEATVTQGAWQAIAGVPRKVCWYVSEDCADCNYRYSGLEYPATVFQPFMEEIRSEVCKLCGIAPEDYPNSCNVNVYEDHSREVGWHSDDEVMFQGLNGDTRIISFSLGSARDFGWRLQGTSKELGRVPLGDGDVMTMEGRFQKHYKHSVPPSEQQCGKRINFTFRWIKVKAHAADAGTKGVAN